MKNKKVIKIGSVFVVAPIYEIRKHKINLVKTTERVLLDDDEASVWEKRDWDECPKIDQLCADLALEFLKLEEYLEENVRRRMVMGLYDLQM